MKELSIEEKARRYDEALEWARKVMQGKVGFVLDEVLERFPELKESEDERIRKEIEKDAEVWYKEHYEGSNPQGRSIVIGAYIDGAIAWLEKQGENNMGISETTKRKLEDNLNKALEKETTESWNGFLDEQKPVNETPYPETLEKAIDLYYYSYGNGEGGFEHLSLEKFRDIVHTFVSDYGQKTAWSEKDSPYYDDICEILINILHSETADVNKDAVQKDLDWLISLRPQINVTDEELAQAKKDAYNNALDKIEYHSGEPTFDDGWSAAINYIRKK